MRGEGEPVSAAIPTREKRAVTVARAILQDIRERGLPPGAHLPSEAELLARYRVARGTLREALRILEVHGLIRIRFGRDGGAVVQAPTPLDFSQVLTLFLQGLDVTVKDVLEARMAVEPLMAMLAARCDDEEKRDDLRAILDRTTHAATWDDFTEAMGAFHTRVLSMSGNPVLDLLAVGLQQMISYPVMAFRPKVRDAIRDDHLAIGEAILAGDGEAAWDLMAAHMAEQQRFARYDAAFLRGPVDWRSDPTP